MSENVRGKGYRPKVGDMVTFKHRVHGRLHTSVGLIRRINSDKTFDIHVASGYHYPDILRRYIIEKVGDEARRRKG
jgi:hypothetical protein